MERINRRQRANMTEEQFNTFRMEMKRLRKANHLSAASLSEIVGCATGHIYTIESGKKYPSDELAKDIADVFDTTIEDMCKTPEARSVEQRAEVSKSLIERRIAKGFKMSEVAGFLGVDRTAYMDMESGKASVAESIANALDRLYAEDKQVETIEVIREIPAECPIPLPAIDKVIEHIADMNLDVKDKRALFRVFSDARTTMLEEKYFG